MSDEIQMPSFMKVKPQKQHHWLQKLVGEWTIEEEIPATADRPAQKQTGTETVRPIGGFWILAEGRGQMPGGGEASTVMTLGFDPQKQRFVGTWIGSMMTYLWVYDGELDAAERVLSLYAEGPSMADDGTTARYRETIELRSDDHRVFSSHMLGADGSWKPLMTASYRRK
jgi:hypothetical protein